MELPEEKGTYIFICSVAEMKRIEIGRLGQFDVIPGFYAYVGTASGIGGVRAQIDDHLASTTQPHWHIDHLLTFAKPVEVWYAISDRRLEQDWAELLENAPFFRRPIPRFGSSDYRRSRTTHLFHSKRRPSFRWFHDQIRELFDVQIQPQQFVFAKKEFEGLAQS